MSPRKTWEQENHRASDKSPENKTAAESVGRSRRRYLQRFSASVPVRSRLFRQRRGVVDHLHAVAVNS
jgi:hypothetical protein